MFSIDYGILEDTKEEIQELSKENFKDNPEIYGQFELKLDNYIIGYVDEEIPFENELVLTWFNFFTESCKNILTNSYSIFCVIDLKDFWLELKKEKHEIRINRKKPIQQEIPFLISKKSEEEYFNSDSEKLMILSEIDFFTEIYIKGKNFIDTIEELNKELLDIEVLANIQSNLMIIMKELEKTKRK